MTKIILVLCYIIVAPFIGAILEGFDRKISARMQRRVGPPIRQPLFDVIKLFKKQIIVVDRSQSFLIMSYLLLTIMTGCMFYAGVDLLMIFFVLSSAAVFIYFAATVTGSPMSTMGGLRELVQDMAYEPAVLMAAVGFYLTTGSFEVDEIVKQDMSAIIRMPGFFIAFVFILTIKMRKSPFDISTSHHPNQEIVKGITSELGAKNLAVYTLAEWYETVFLMGMVALFILNKNLWSILAAVIVVFLVYFLEILIDNSSARMKSDLMIKLSWGVTLALAGTNFLVLIYMFN
jgi:ech hydrogenase subunit B